MPEERRPNIVRVGFQAPSSTNTVEDFALAEAAEFINSTEFAHTYDLFRIGDHTSVRVEIRPRKEEGEISVSLFCCAFEPRLVDWNKLRITVVAKVSGFARLSATGVVQLILKSPSILSLKASSMLRLHSEPRLNRGLAAAPSSRLHSGTSWKDVVWHPDDSDLQISFQLNGGILIVAAFTTAPRDSIKIRMVPSANESGLIEVQLGLESNIPLKTFEKLKLEPPIQESFHGYIGLRQFPLGPGPDECIVTLV